MKKDLFKNRKIVIATMHGKERVISPILQKHLGVIPVVANIDTDQFGTFTRDIKRTGDQLDTARRKAYAALQATDADLVVASEGSFSADQRIPFLTSNTELVLLIDTKNEFEVRGYYQTNETNMAGEYVSSIDQALVFAKKVGFPEHGLIVRKNAESKKDIYKNIKTEQEYRKLVTQLLGGLFTTKIYVETDMRAHNNPTRMKAIEYATNNLIHNLRSCCPQCDTPGFIPTDFEAGLPCSHCFQPTDLPYFEIYTCGKCQFQNKKKFEKYGDFADPHYCAHCNP